MRRLIRPLAKLLKTCGRAAVTLAPPFADGDAAFCESRDWSHHYRPQPEGDYEFIADYALRKWEITEATFQALDDKASKLFTLAAALAGVLFSLAQWLDLEFGRWLAAAFVCFLSATVYATIAQLPVDLHTPFNIRRILAVAEEEGGSDERIRARLSASAHTAIVGTRVANEWKADKLVLITVLVCAGIACLFPVLMTS